MCHLDCKERIVIEDAVWKQIEIEIWQVLWIKADQKTITVKFQPIQAESPAVKVVVESKIFLQIEGRWARECGLNGGEIFELDEGVKRRK